ncbi:hypothetical protein [Amycolatopsis sp. GM8]|uniref:hypothetical protein n=1 Tax=Amycolatopsis sp. GM8 TaxID=2896530 RepID=UPI001F472300|nr:hypothetical protein [Amycolatopsis sp. GM8]
MFGPGGDFGVECVEAFEGAAVVAGAPEVRVRLPGQGMVVSFAVVVSFGEGCDECFAGAPVVAVRSAGGGCCEVGGGVGECGVGVESEGVSAGGVSPHNVPLRAADRRVG